MKISTCAHLHILLYPYINSQIEFEPVREADGLRLPYLASHVLLQTVAGLEWSAGQQWPGDQAWPAMEKAENHRTVISKLNSS